MLLFSAEKMAFFSPQIHAEADIPSDVVDVSAALHAELMAGQTAGMRIVIAANGQPALAERAPPSEAQLWQRHQLAAQEALATSDITMIRCVENGVAVPPAWATYRASLRAIVRAASGDPTQPLPTRPAYPAGT